MKPLALGIYVIFFLMFVCANGQLNNSQQEEIEKAKLEANTYCTTPWPHTPTSGASKWQSPKRPIVLIPGIAGSMLHSPLGTQPETWKKLWIAFTSQDDIAMRYVAGVFNGTYVVERNPFHVVPRTDGDGLCSIDILDPDLLVSRSDSEYYHQMILYLISIGYTPGLNLFGFPYDWRQSVRTPATMERLHSLIHRLHQATGLPVDIMTHSMGGLVTKSYVATYLEDTASVLGTWIAIGTPWRGGGAVAYKAIISGYSLDMTTVPILNWGLSEPVAHAIEINWPTTFELLPDLDHDDWWKASRTRSRPAINYQITGQPPSTADTSQQIKPLLLAVNANNREIFPPAIIPIPNPLNMLAWNQSDGTRKLFAALTTRLAEFRQTHPSSTFRVYSIEGNKMPTKYSVNFEKSVFDPTGLTKATPQYSLVEGDGTVPYASAISDGMGATHFTYAGLQEHQRLLRTPEIFQSVRHSLGLSCSIEGVWDVEIYDPNGIVFARQTWTFDNESILHSPSGTLQYGSDVFNSSLPDGTPISGSLDRGCVKFSGSWYTTYRTAGARRIGNECFAGDQILETPIPNGKSSRPCIYGTWSNKSTISCEDGFTLVEHDCVKIQIPEFEPPPVPGTPTHIIPRKTILIVLLSITSVVILGVVIAVAVWVSTKKHKSPPDNGYKVLSFDDESLNTLSVDQKSDNSFISDEDGN